MKILKWLMYGGYRPIEMTPPAPKPATAVPEKTCDCVKTNPSACITESILSDLKVVGDWDWRWYSVTGYRRYDYRRYVSNNVKSYTLMYDPDNIEKIEVGEVFDGFSMEEKKRIHDAIKVWMNELVKLEEQKEKEKKLALAKAVFPKCFN